MIHTNPHDTDDPRVTLTIEISLPTAKAAAFRDALTGEAGR